MKKEDLNTKTYAYGVTLGNPSRPLNQKRRKFQVDLCEIEDKTFIRTHSWYSNIKLKICQNQDDPSCDPDDPSCDSDDPSCDSDDQSCDSDDQLSAHVHTYIPATVHVCTYLLLYMYVRTYLLPYMYVCTSYCTCTYIPATVHVRTYLLLYMYVRTCY